LRTNKVIYQLVVEVEQDATGPGWAARCSEVGRGDLKPGLAKKNSEGAAIRAAVQNFIHLRGPAAGSDSTEGGHGG
jgi:hypothetical protein